MQILVNSIYIEYEDYGDNTDPALVLIRGLGSQLIHWPKNFISGLVEVGYRVIIFDNRDIGLSSRCPLNGVPYDKQSIIKKIDSGQKIMPAYSLDDMALDVIGLMNELDIAKAHIFGMSLGGVITQVLAINYPHRLISATIVMSAAKLVDSNRIKQVALDHIGKDEFMEIFTFNDLNWTPTSNGHQLEWSLDLATFLKNSESSIDLKTEFLTHTGSGQLELAEKVKNNFMI